MGRDASRRASRFFAASGGVRSGGFQPPASGARGAIGGEKGEAELLASCYRTSLEIALGQPGINTIAFPCISTGVYGYPIEEAAKVAITTCSEHGAGLEITFCCFSAADLAVYERQLA